MVLQTNTTTSGTGGMPEPIPNSKNLDNRSSITIIFITMLMDWYAWPDKTTPPSMALSAVTVKCEQFICFTRGKKFSVKIDYN